MATNSDYIASAMRLAQILAEGETPSAEQGADMLAAMNDMMASMAEDGIDLGYSPQSSTTDTLLINLGSREAVKYLLAARACALFEKPIPPIVAQFAQDGYKTMLRTALYQEMQPSTFEQSPFNTGRRFDITNG